jgi:hypothetical protein
MLGNSDEHRSYEDFAVRHVMGSLDEAESSTFRSHLLDCAECRARVGELRSIASDLVEVERAERRERAAKLVETKEREEDEGTDLRDPVEGPGRGGRLLAIAGVGLIVVLSIWNFVLRGQNASLQAFATALQESAEVVNFGDAWTTEETAPGVQGIARIEDGRLAVMVRGTDDQASYQLKRYDAEGALLDAMTVESVDGQIRWFGGPLRADTHRVAVTLDRMNGDTIIFRAVAEPTSG